LQQLLACDNSNSKPQLSNDPISADGQNQVPPTVFSFQGKKDYHNFCFMLTLTFSRLTMGNFSLDFMRSVNHNFFNLIIQSQRLLNVLQIHSKNYMLTLITFFM